MSILLTLRQLLQQSGLTLMAQLGGTALSFVTQVMLARCLGPGGQGQVNVAATMATLALLCCSLGTPVATIFYVSRGQITAAHAMVYSRYVALLLGGAGAGALVTGVWLCKQTLWPQVPVHAVLWAAALVAPLLWCQLVAAVLVGTQAFGCANCMLLIAPLCTCIGTAIALALGDRGNFCLAALLVGQAMAASWGSLQMPGLVENSNSLAPADPDAAVPPRWSRPAAGLRAHLQALMGFGLLAALANALAYASLRLDVLLLGAWAPRTAVGHYAVAASIAERLWMLSQAVNMILFAQVARTRNSLGAAVSTASGAALILAQRKPASAQESSTHARAFNPTPVLLRHVLWAVIPAAGVLFAASPWLVPRLFGAAYQGAVRPLQILLPGVVIFNIARTLGQDFAGRGHVRLNVAVGAVCLAVNVGLNVVWIPRFGAVGAAWASSLAYGLDSAMKLALYQRLLALPWQQMLFLQYEDWRRLRQLRCRPCRP